MQITHTQRRGFTLIELLVVIAIIAVLAAILFPVFATAREKARQAHFLNNKKQIATAVMMFAQDHEQTIFADPGSQSWCTYLTQYITGPLYACPSVKASQPGSSSTPNYGFNPTLYNTLLTEITQPSIGLMLADMKPVSARAQQSGSLGSMDTDIDQRHGGGFIFACIDGHVVYQSGASVSASNSNAVTKSLLNAGFNPYPGGKLVISDPRPVIAMGGSDNKWHDSSFAFTLPTGSYRQYATDPCPQIAAEWDMNRWPISNGYTGCEYMYSMMGIFCSSAEVGYYSSSTGGLSNPTTGYYFGYKAYAADNYDANDNGWTNLYSNGSHYFAQGADANTLTGSPAAKLIMNPMRTWIYYHVRAMITGGTCYLTVTDTSNNKILGTTVNTLNLANDCAPGNNLVVGYCYTRSDSAYEWMKNLKVYQLNATSN